jgi:hypothetical protein
MRKRRRLLLIGVLLYLLILFLVPSVISAQGVAVSIDAPAEVDADTNFIARVNITDVTNFNACNYNITYDPSVFKLTDVTDGLIGDTAIPAEHGNELSSGTTNTTIVAEHVPGISGVSGSGYLAELHFHVIGEYNITSDIVIFNGILGDNTAAPIQATWTGASVNVIGLPPPTPSPIGTTPTPGGTTELQINMWDQGNLSGNWAVNKQGVLQQNASASSLDGGVTIHIPQNATLLGSANNPLTNISITPIAPPADPPADYHILKTFDFKPDGATFNPGITITISFNPSDVPAGKTVVIAFYNVATGSWEFTPGTINADNTASFTVTHFSAYSFMYNGAAKTNVAMWAGIGIGILLVLLIAILLMRRRKTAKA